MALFHSQTRRHMIKCEIQYEPQKVHVENGSRHKADENVEESREKDSRHTGSLNMFEMVPEFGKICCWYNAVILVSLK